MVANWNFLKRWRDSPPPAGSLLYLAVSCVVAVVYFGVGKLGLLLAYANPSSTAIWPGTGIALAAMLIFGSRMWPALFVASFFVNFGPSGGPIASLIIAAGNTFEAVIGAYFVRRFADDLDFLSRAKSMFRFIVLVAGLSTAMAATIGVLDLSFSGRSDWSRFGHVWLTWWLGDAVGDLVMTPLLVLALFFRPRVSSGARPVEAVLLLLVLAGAAWFFAPANQNLKFLCIPLVLWGAFRFGNPGAAISVFLMAGFMIGGSLTPPYAAIPSVREQTVLYIAAFIGIAAAMGHLLASVISERSDAEAELRRARDVLAQRADRADKALVGAEQRLVLRETLLTHSERISHTGSFQWDTRNDRVLLSDEMLRICGRRAVEFRGTFAEFVAYVHSDDRNRFHEIVEDALLEPEERHGRMRIVRPDGEVRVIETTVETLVDGEGRIAGLCGVCRDVSNEVESERRLVESEDRFRLLVDRVRDYAIILLDGSGHIASWNEGAQRIKGYTPEEIIGSHFSVLYTPEDRRRNHPEALLREARAAGTVEDEGWRIRKDGTRFWADVVITALHDDGGELRGFAKVTRDLTERRQSEVALSELSGRLLRVQDEERQRIASDLHDTTSPQLTSLVGKLYGLQRRPDLDPAVAAIIDESRTLAENVSRIIRGISSTLHPPMLEQNGLFASLRWYAESFARRTGIQVDTVFPSSLPAITSEAELVLFRIVQEGMTNVQRHSEATRVTIRLIQEGDETRLSIEDNGKGMPVSSLGKTPGDFGITGVGIRIMAERIKQYGGRLEIRTDRPGTTVIAVLPRGRTPAQIF